MKVIKYEVCGKNKYNVFLENGEVLTLYEKVITDNELLLKKDIDNELYEKITNDNRIYEMVETAIKYINVRLRSIKEIKDYLKKKNVSDEDINIVIDILLKNKYLDDDRFSEAFIKDKINFTMMGDYKMRMELQRLGVDNMIIEEKVSLISDELWEEKMKKIIDKDIRTNKKYSGISLKNKIYNHLVTQGYSKEKVISVINSYEF